MVNTYTNEFKEQITEEVLRSLATGEQIEFDVDEFNYNYDKDLVDDYIETQNEAGNAKNDWTIDTEYLKGALKYTANDDLEHYTLTLLEELFNRRYNTLLSTDLPDISKDDPYIEAMREADFHRFRKDPVVQDFISILIKAVDGAVLSLYDDSHGSGTARQYVHTIYGDEGDGLGIVVEQQSLF